MKRVVIILIVLLIVFAIAYIAISKVKKNRDKKLSEIDSNLTKKLSDNTLENSAEYQANLALANTSQDVYLGAISDPYSDLINLG